MVKIMGCSRKQLIVMGYLEMEGSINCLIAETTIVVDGNQVNYEHLSKARYKLLAEWKFYCQHYMYFIDEYDNLIPIQPNFSLPLSSLPIDQNPNGLFRMLIKSLNKFLKEQLFLQIDYLKSQLASVKQLLSTIPKKQELQNFRSSHSLPTIKHSSSVANRSFCNRELDVGILFSQPIYDGQLKKAADSPVGFRPQIDKLKHALKNGFVDQVNIKAQRATLVNLKSMIQKSTPKMLHISCHGEENGDLKFQDDSLQNLGLLRRVSPQTIIRQLQKCGTNLPSLAFVNSCHSQIVGIALQSIGIKYVITINSKDQIKDMAAQIFSQHFYRSIFRGQVVPQAFESAKIEVQNYHDIHGCCCYHDRQVHKSGCKWKFLEKQNPNAHALYHVPPAQCGCQKKDYNVHSYKCKWAIKTMFTINQDFCVLNQQTQEREMPIKKGDIKQFLFDGDFIMICCCLEVGKIPHSQSYKFKMISKCKNHEPIYDIQRGFISNGAVQIHDFSAPQFLWANQILPKTMFGREQQLYRFFKFIKDNQGQNVITLVGASGSGKSTFILKAASYMIQRRVVSAFHTINLSNVNDSGIFRYKFNEATRLNFDGRQILQNVRDKNIFIILDNCDQFISEEAPEFYRTINNLSKGLRSSKIVLVMQKQKFSDCFSEAELPSVKFQLGPLNLLAAARTFFAKIKYRLHPTIKFNDILCLVQQKKSLQNPKAIESICQSLNSQKKELTLEKLKKKVHLVGDGQLAANGLIEDNLKKLFISQNHAYELLIFISQFSEGISLTDINMFSRLYDQDEQRTISLPIRKEWCEDLKQLAQELKINERQSGLMFTSQQQNIKSKVVAQELQQGTIFQTSSEFDHPENESPTSERSCDQIIQQTWQITMRDSYFISKVDKDKVVVKKYIRQYIWEEYTEKTNIEMKYIFVSYICVMLELLFDIFRKQYHVHQQIFNCSSISLAGAFNYRTNLAAFYKTSITESAHRARTFSSALQKIIHQSRNFQDKVRLSDPSVFILNHKQDFLNIYKLNWLQIYDQLSKRPHSQHKVFLCFYENLLVHIPTALRVAKAELQFQKSLIGKSITLMKKLKRYTPLDRYFKIHFKLAMMKIQCQMEQKFPSRQFFDSTFTDLEETLSQCWKELENGQETSNLLQQQKKHTMLYYQSLVCREPKKILEKIKNCLKEEKWDCDSEGEATRLLKVKRGTLLCQTYLQFFRIPTSVTDSGSSKFLRVLNRGQKQNNIKFLQIIQNCYYIFTKNKFFKLALRAKFIQLELTWQLEIDVEKTAKNIQIQTPLHTCKMLLEQCEQILRNKTYKLGGFSQFQQKIVKLTRDINQKLWENSRNTIIFMRAVPVNRGKAPVFHNLVRRSHNFRCQIESILKQKSIRQKQRQQSEYSPFRLNQLKQTQRNRTVGLSVKFEILTRQKLKEETKYGCSLMILTTNSVVLEEQVYIAVENEFMGEQLIHVNKDFVEDYHLEKIDIFIMIGVNSNKLIGKLKQVMIKHPLMIALNEQAEPQYQSHQQQQPLRLIRQFLSTRQKATSLQLEYIKEFISQLRCQKITSPEDIILIHHQASKKMPELRAQIRPQIIPMNTNLKRVGNSDDHSFVIDLRDSNFKNLSPGYQNNYNVQMDNAEDHKNSLFVLRRWEQLRATLSHVLTETGEKRPAYVNVYGEKHSGKTFFAEELVRVMVQRQLFAGGVFLIKGEIVQKKFSGDFLKYITKQSQKGRLPNLDYFIKAQQRAVMFIVDDFNHVTPRSSSTESQFIQKIIQLQINFLFITNSPSLHEHYNFPLLKSIELKRMKQLQINILAYNIVSNWDEQTDLLFQQLKTDRKSKITVKDLQALNKKQKKKQKFVYGPSNKVWDDKKYQQIKMEQQKTKSNRQEPTVRKRTKKNTRDSVMQEQKQYEEFMNLQDDIQFKESQSMMQISKKKQ